MTLAGVWGGSVKALKVFAAGESITLGDEFFGNRSN